VPSSHTTPRDVTCRSPIRRSVVRNTEPVANATFAPVETARLRLRRFGRSRALGYCPSRRDVLRTRRTATVVSVHPSTARPFTGTPARTVRATYAAVAVLHRSWPLRLESALGRSVGLREPGRQYHIRESGPATSTRGELPAARPEPSRSENPSGTPAECGVFAHPRRRNVEGSGVKPRLHKMRLCNGRPCHSGMFHVTSRHGINP
jgi:hypothetical protein